METEPTASLATSVDAHGASVPAGVGRRIAWTIADQALSSASNLGTGIVAARSLERQSFGAFGLAFTVYILTTGTCRALVTEPLVSAYSHVSRNALRSTIQAAAGSALTIGVLGAILVAGSAVLLGGLAQEALIALAVVLPGLLLQDAWRYCFVTSGRPSAALINDLFWCTLQLGLLVPLVMSDRLTLTTILLWWGGAGSIAGLMGCIQATMVPTISSAWRWIRAHSELSGRYTAEYIAASGASQATLLALGAISGLTALGAIRGAQVFYGPTSVFFGGIYLALGAEGVRVRADPIKLRRFMGWSSGALLAAGAAWVLIGVGLPADIGRALFGDTWLSARGVIVPMGLALIGNCVAAGAVIGLRALAAAKASLRGRLLGLPFAVILPLAGSVGGARGFALGMSGASWIGALIWWRQFRKALDGTSVKDESEREFNI